jgi:hypothetical protein
MDVRIDVPDDIVHRMKTRWSDLPRRTLQALAIESYRAGVITEAEVQRMLNLPSRWDADAVLKEAQAYSEYTDIDLREDIDAIHRLRSQ